MEFTLLAAAALGVAAMSITLRLLPTAGVSRALSKSLSDPAFAAIGAGILIGRLASMIGNGTNPFSHPGDILIVRGGVSTGFASLAAITAWLIAVRPDHRMASDAMAGAALMGLAGWHAGCVFRATCAGTVTDLPWAITLSASPVGRHPVELYAVLVLVAAALLVRRRGAGRGSAAAWALVAAAGARLITEPFRASLSGGPVIWYVAGMTAGLIIIGLIRRTSDP